MLSAVPGRRQRPSSKGRASEVPLLLLLPIRDRMGGLPGILVKEEGRAPGPPGLVITDVAVILRFVSTAGAELQS